MLDNWGQVAHPKTILTVLFFLGILFRFFIRGDKAKRDPLRKYPTRVAFWVNNWSVFLIRTVLVNLWLFVIWLYHPDWATWVLLKLKVPPAIADWTPIAPNLVSAPLFGLWIDVALDKGQKFIAPLLPSWAPDVLKGEIPCYDSDMVATDKLPDNQPK